MASIAASSLAGVAPAQDRSGLQDRLTRLARRHRIPGASAAVLLDSEIVGRMAVGADPDTLFQAASISKTANAVVVLRLAEQGRLSLDAPVNAMLRSWSLPGAGAGAVTPRLLLSHRAGTTVAGFPGYVPDGRRPDLRQILDGLPPANTPPVRVAWPPGQAFRYSGGGTMVLQRLVMDVSERDYDDLVRDLVLSPAGMTRSGFFQPPSPAVTDRATAHDGDGRPLPGGFHVYPEHAAAGLWSTPSELARLALMIAASWRAGGVLSRSMARAMATPVGGGPTGLGLFVRARGGDRPPWLYHYGVNAGFRSILVFAADGSFGLALMTNGEGGRQLIPAFLADAFAAHGQDPFRPAE
ncbi:serine hydrolase domain-containing protein [Reyranella sp.]|uniref:serine hydrolase domain-containing protein n=1 Tax=Reyranella sp. TaxID=1929291 RepID=UPI003BA8A03D